MFVKKHEKKGGRYNYDKNLLYTIRFLDDKVDIAYEDYKIEIKKSEFGDPNFWNDFIIVSNPNSRITNVFKDGSLFKTYDGSTNTLNQSFIIVGNKVGSKRSLSILNQNFESIKTFENSWARRYINSSIFVHSQFRKRYLLEVYNFLSDKKTLIKIENQLWTNLEGETFDGEVFQIIGQWKNELLISLGRFRLVSFDLDTGKELWRIEDFIEEISSNPIIESRKRRSIKWLLSATENKAYLLVLNYLFELDLTQKKSQLIKDYNESTGKEWYFSSSRIYDDYITFSGANVLGKFPMVAGVIDRNTKEIRWSTKCEPGVYFEDAPQIKENKLYILDSSKTLHIFEKENHI